MAKPFRKRKCLHCGNIFEPDPRNARKQQYCGQPACRAASKAAAQARWRAKPENQNYFRGPENIHRVQEWRRRHPGYWRRGAKKDEDALQDHCGGNEMEKQEVVTPLPPMALQDVYAAQQALLIGLIAHLTGTALQDDIARMTRRLQKLGTDILFPSIPSHRGEGDVGQNSHLSRKGPPDSGSIQLGGRAPGP